MDMISGYKAATEVCSQNKWDLLLQLGIASPIQTINDKQWQYSENSSFLPSFPPLLLSLLFQSHILLRKINYLKEFFFFYWEPHLKLMN